MLSTGESWLTSVCNILENCRRHIRHYDWLVVHSQIIDWHRYDINWLIILYWYHWVLHSHLVASSAILSRPTLTNRPPQPGPRQASCLDRSLDMLLALAGALHLATPTPPCARLHAAAQARCGGGKCGDSNLVKIFWWFIGWRFFFGITKWYYGNMVIFFWLVLWYYNLVYKKDRSMIGFFGIAQCTAKIRWLW